MKADSSQFRRLEAVLRHTHDGARTCVLVLGDGLNAQAVNESGSTGASEWIDLLRRLGRELNLPVQRDALDSTLHWNELVNGWRHAKGCTSSRAESVISARLCALLRSVEAGRVKGDNLYSTLIRARFANIISLSVDQRLVQAIPRPQRSEHLTAQFLSRHVRMRHDDGLITHIWLPYGTSGRQATLELGFACHRRRVMELERARDDLMNGWVTLTDGLRPPWSVFEERWRRPSRWYDVFCLGPLVFIGTSLSPHDWPLWWLLHQRMRNLNPIPPRYRPPAFYLTTAKASAGLPHLGGRPAGLEMVPFASFDALWLFVRRALSKRPEQDSGPAWHRLGHIAQFSKDGRAASSAAWDPAGRNRRS